MDSDDWKAFQEEGKKIKRGRMERHCKAIYTFAMQHNLRHTAIQPWHVRLSDGMTAIDFFPQAKRYHNLTTGKRGDYHHLKGFLNSIFGNGTGQGSGKGPT